MMAQPSAADLFTDFHENSSPKFALALERIKAACDHIEAAKGAMTYSQVGKMAVKLFGGPKAQSILNNQKHKMFIDARRLEYLGTMTRTAPHERNTDQVLYPSDGLDFKTRRYIDDLRQRNAMLEAAMRELKQQVLTATESTPLDLERMLKTGPGKDLAMEIRSTTNSQINPDARDALGSLLADLPVKVAAIELYQGKALRLRTGEWLVNPIQYELLTTLVKAGD